MTGHGRARMVSRIAVRIILVMRQREGLGAGYLLDVGFAGSKGGRVRDLPGNLFCDQEGNQPGVFPGLWSAGSLAASSSSPARLFIRLKASSICQRKR